MNPHTADDIASQPPSEPPPAFEAGFAWQQASVHEREPLLYRAGRGGQALRGSADPIATEVLRHGLLSAAGQMKSAIIRTSFSQLIHEVLDFAVALYDRKFRLLAQGTTLPLFSGTFSFATEAAVDMVGGERNLQPGDVLVLNWPFATGAHGQDSCLIMPIFVHEDEGGDPELVGYAIAKQHWMDIGAQDPYCANTTDVFQEGTFYPAVKLYSGGTLVSDIQRLLVMNSRMPELLISDLHAQVTGLRAGEAALRQLVERNGVAAFADAIELMFDHAESMMQRYISTIPDGRYEGYGELDNDGLDDESIPFRVVIEVQGSQVTVDLSDAPGPRRGPVNTPFPTTAAAVRLALSLLAGGGEAPNEGTYRPIGILTRPGSMFHALAPSPCFLYMLTAYHVVDVIYRALYPAIPDKVPACSGGNQCGMMYWGRHPLTGQPWGDGPPFPAGKGAHAHGDGQNCVADYIAGTTRFTPAEVHETKSSFLIWRLELAADSGGPGKFRGGLGMDLEMESVDDSSYICPIVERTKSPPWGLAGGGAGQPNSAVLNGTDGSTVPLGHGDTYVVPKGATIGIHSGGGGGFGPPDERDPAAVLDDLENGYITRAYVARHHPQVLAVLEEERDAPAAQKGVPRSSAT